MEIHNLDDYRELRNQDLVKLLTGEIFHVTNTESYRSIRNCGQILPNDGSRKGKYERRAPNLTVCEKFEAISLFNLTWDEKRLYPLNEVEGLEPSYTYFLEWGKFLWLYKPITVILVLGKKTVENKLVQEPKLLKAEGQWISNVESCHEGPIDLNNVKLIILAQAKPGPSKGKHFKVFERAVISDKEIESVIESWT